MAAITWMADPQSERLEPAKKRVIFIVCLMLSRIFAAKKKEEIEPSIALCFKCIVTEVAQLAVVTAGLIEPTFQARQVNVG